MDRVFLDANVLFSAAYDPARNLARLWRLPDVVLITSAYAVTEVIRNLTRKFPDRLSGLARLLSDIELVPEALKSTFPSEVDLHPKDVPILLAAIEAKATHLLTGDHDFEKYFGQTIENVLILRPAQYLRDRDRL